MNQLQNKSFEEALVRYREKWDKIKDPCVVYDFPIPDVSCKELFLKRVSEHPDKTYVISRGTKMSYVECNTLAAKIANGFLAKGLKKGDRVITYVSNGFEFVALAHACFKTGIIMVNTNPRSTADEIIRRIKDCTPKMVITDSDGADAVVQALKDDKAGVEHMVFCPALEKENRWDELGAWESIISDDASEPDISISPEDIAILQYTGGTTGVLKGCCQTNHAFVAKAMAQVQYFRPFLNDNDYENYMVIIALGMSHAFGFGQGIVVNLTMGGTIFFAESLDEILRVIEKYRPTVWPSVPLWMKLIATHEEYQKYDISSLKVITCGSAPLPVDVIRRVEELTGAVITEGYGMTETVNTITINGHDHRKVGKILVAADRYALAFMHVYEQADGAFCAVGSFELTVGLEKVGLARAGDKGLRAVDDKFSVYKLGGRLHSGCIGACAGLRERKCRALFALYPRNNVFLLLLLGAVVENGEAHVGLTGNGFRDRAAGLGKLLNGKNIVNIAAAEATVFLRDNDAAEAKLVHFLQQRLNAEKPLVDLQRVRTNALVGILFVYHLQCAFFFCKNGVHRINLL